MVSVQHSGLDAKRQVFPYKIYRVVWPTGECKLGYRFVRRKTPVFRQPMAHRRIRLALVNFPKLLISPEFLCSQNGNRHREATGHRAHGAKAGAGGKPPTPGPRKARRGGERGKPRDRDEPGQRATRTAERQTQGGTAPRRDPTAGRTQGHGNHRNETDTARQTSHDTPPQSEPATEGSHPPHRRRERRKPAPGAPDSDGREPQTHPPSGSAGGGEREGPEVRTGARARSGEANPCARPQRTAPARKSPPARRGENASAASTTGRDAKPRTARSKEARGRG